MGQGRGNGKCDSQILFLHVTDGLCITSLKTERRGVNHSTRRLQKPRKVNDSVPQKNAGDLWYSYITQPPTNLIQAHAADLHFQIHHNCPSQALVG